MFTTRLQQAGQRKYTRLAILSKDCHSHRNERICRTTQHRNQAAGLASRGGADTNTHTTPPPVCSGASREGGELARLSGLLDELVDQAYDLSRGLWPLEHDGVGVGPSFRDMIQRLAESSAIPIEFRREQACASCRHPHLVQLNRIARESVANALKHARATRIVVAFTCPDGRATAVSSDVIRAGPGRVGEAPAPRPDNSTVPRA